jgi:hypothetical protein
VLVSKGEKFPALEAKTLAVIVHHLPTTVFIQEIVNADTVIVRPKLNDPAPLCGCEKQFRFLRMLLMRRYIHDLLGVETAASF